MVVIDQTTEINIRQDLYHILLFAQPVKYTVETVEFQTHSSALIFLSPFLKFSLTTAIDYPVYHIAFHGDYYCIELHKHEVACNGLLFNSVYQMPHVEASPAVFADLLSVWNKMKNYAERESKFSDSIVKSYLQLLLSIASDEKQQFIDNNLFYTLLMNEEGIVFQELVEKNFKTEKSIQFYAAAMNLSPAAFSRKIKNALHKTPSQIIQERTILEAKKLLHLTYKSVKEIAAELKFSDEHYFSRYFKTNAGVSPLQFRKLTGISPAANLSMD